MKNILVVLVTLFLMVSPAVAEEVRIESDQEKPFSAHDILFSGPELDFFCKYVLNKEFVLPMQTYKLDHGKVECDFVRTGKYCNLSVSTNGFSYVESSQIKQTNYDLDSEGKRILPGRIENRNSASRIAYIRSRATGKLLGFGTTLYNDHPAGGQTGITGKDIAFLEGNKFIVQGIPSGYSDYFAAEGKFTPAVDDINTEIYLEDGKTVRKMVVKTYDVDPETLKQTPRKTTDIYIDYAELDTK